VSASTEKTLFVGIIIAGVLVLLYLFKGQVWGGTSGPEGGGGNSNFATKLEVDQLRSVYLNDTMSVASFATFVAVWLAITIFCLAWMVAYVKKSVKTKTAAGGPTGNAGGANGGTAAVKGGFFQRYLDYFGGLKRAVFSTEDERVRVRVLQQSTSPPQQQRLFGLTKQPLMTRRRLLPNPCVLDLVLQPCQCVSALLKFCH
jgi:hypothetical protein